MKKNKKH